MKEVWEALFLGLVQGLTEFLPISSSGHLLAAREVMGRGDLGLAFDALVQVATLLAVVLYFRREIFLVFTSSLFWPVAVRIGVAVVPIAIVGLLAASARENIRENISPWFVVGGWCFSAAYLLLTRDRAGTRSYAEMPIAWALAVGLAQCLAICPGVSRSGSTIAAGLWLGLGRGEAARFSFLLSIPSLLGPAVYEVGHSSEHGANLWLSVALATATAFVVGLLAIHLLLRLVASDLFHRFGWYNLAAAAAFATYLLLRGPR